MRILISSCLPCYKKSFVLFTLHTSHSQIWCEPVNCCTPSTWGQRAIPDMNSHEMSKVEYHNHKLPPHFTNYHLNHLNHLNHLILRGFYIHSFLNMSMVDYVAWVHTFYITTWWNNISRKHWHPLSGRGCLPPHFTNYHLNHLILQ